MVIGTPRPLYLQERKLVQEAGWAPGTVWMGVENLDPTEFNSWAFQPVASRYTDYAIPAHTN